ncbi:MAG: hypothetical protein ACREMY_15080, partial [bacterium]
ALVVLLAAVICSNGRGSGGVQASDDDTVYYCSVLMGGDTVPPHNFLTQNQFRDVPGFIFTEGAFDYCASAGKNKPYPGFLGFVCYLVTSEYKPQETIRYSTQFETNASVKIGASDLFCTPAEKGSSSGPTPPQPPTAPYFECFHIDGRDPGVTLNINTQFGDSNGVRIYGATEFCTPTTKNGNGGGGYPFVCYTALSFDPDPSPLRLKTQFELLNVDPFWWIDLCVPATKIGKPQGPPTGVLSGVYDVQASPAGNPALSDYHCIANVEHDHVSNDVKTALQCYSDLDLSDPNAEPLNAPPGETPGDQLPGPPPPPPYTTANPSKLYGGYDAVGDTLTQTGCFRNIGGPLGPNTIWKVFVPNALADMPSGVLHGQLSMYPNQSLGQCSLLTPDTHGGPPPSPLTLTLYKAGSPGESPWRRA